MTEPTLYYIQRDDNMRLAEVVEFADGKCAVQWIGGSAIAIHDTLQDVKKKHCHDSIRLISKSALLKELPQEIHKRLIRQATDERITKQRFEEKLIQEYKMIYSEEEYNKLHDELYFDLN